MALAGLVSRTAFVPVDGQDQLDHGQQRRHRQQHDGEDRVTCPCGVVFADAPAEGNNEHSVRGEGVAAIPVQQDQICGGEHDNLHGEDGQGPCGGIVHGGDLVPAVGEHHGEVEQRGHGHPGRLNGQAVEDEPPGEPDLLGAALLCQVRGGGVQRLVGHGQRGVHPERVENQRRERDLQLQAVEADEPGHAETRRGC